MRQIKIYDTTLRDGTQAEDFNLSLADKIRIAQKLAKFGVHFIEGGWPGSNPKDKEFFDDIRNYNLGNSQIAAFGSTHHKDRPPESDPVFQELLLSRAKVFTIFGKSSVFQVKEILKTSLSHNLELITDSLSYLGSRAKKLFYDAEHFFDAFKEDRDYALSTLAAALKGGAQYLVLCDTNGGTLTSELIEIIKAVKKRFPKASLGIHAHNDSELAVANSIAAVELGCSQVQGTINGVGERCGNANLCSIIPALKLKMGIDCISDENLSKMTEVSRFVYELANIAPNRYQPYVGVSAFAHKGGVHAAAVKKNPKAYEHIQPGLVGNTRGIPVSELSGRSNIMMKAEEIGLDVGEHDEQVRKFQQATENLIFNDHEYKKISQSLKLFKNTIDRFKEDINIHDSNQVSIALSEFNKLIEYGQKKPKLPPYESNLKIILDRVKDLESQGYHFESAEASLEMLLRAALGKHKEYFRLLSYRVVDDKSGEEDVPVPEATIRVRVGLHEVHTAAMGNGPVNALFKALLKALIRFYPRLAEMRLQDYKVRVLPGTGSTDAKVRVLIESRDAHDRWGTVGVSHDIIEASWQALVDSINYKLFRDEQGAKNISDAPHRCLEILDPK